MALGIRITDSNDRFTVTITTLSAADLELPGFKADIIDYVKTRAASLPSVGTITARETVETSTYI